MEDIKVSVIVPVFNASEYIGRTLDSIISQDFESFEVIVVDDGSTDDSLEVINNTLGNTQIPHKIIHQENQGVSVARNVGIDASVGDYLVFIDADELGVKEDDPDFGNLRGLEGDAGHREPAPGAIGLDAPHQHQQQHDHRKQQHRPGEAPVQADGKAGGHNHDGHPGQGEDQLAVEEVGG